MLLYERIAYNDFVQSCVSIKLKTLIEGNETSIRDKAAHLNIDLREFKRQIGLHVPQFLEHQYLEPRFLNKKIYPILERLLEGYPFDYSDYRLKCGADLLECNENEVLHIVRKGFVCPGTDAILKAKSKNAEDQTSTKIGLIVKEVSEDVGRFIESRLHYLHSFRDDAIYRLGLYIVGYVYPICYLSFSNIDRDEKAIALSKSLSVRIESKHIIELSRVYGCGNLPRNAISFLISKASKMLMKYDYMITAVNMNLGCSGNSMMASGFIPYAFRPVHYAYDCNRYYCTKRKGQSEMPISPNPTIPNVLYVREIKFTKYTNRKYCVLIKIKDGEFKLLGGAIEPEISEIRTDLEEVWNEKTRYHGTTVMDSYRPSKGQCGVSSLHLARRLVGKGYSALFCEGDVVFEKRQEHSIFNHCWVKVVNYRNRGKDVIIDITADQNGYGQKIIFKEKDELKELKIKYKAKTEKKPDVVDVEHLIQRLEYLEEELQKSNSNVEV